MIKLIIGLLIGIMLTTALFLGPLSPTVGRAEVADTTPTPEEAAESYRALIIATLQEAGNEIQDADLAQFYQKLLTEYHLEEDSTWLVVSDNTSSVELVPDFEKITNVAITLPLEEAGKQIRDKDIAQFYYKFLRDAGWQIKPN